MEEKQLTEPIPLEEFKDKAAEIAEHNHATRVEAFEKTGILSLRTYEGVSKFKSIRRAIRRGHVSLYGDVYPRRPFSNRKRKKGTATYERRLVYEQFRKQATN